MGESARVAVGSGVTVKGIGVGGDVAVEEGAGVSVWPADVDWQAVIRMRHPIRRIFSIVLIKTQLSGALFQTIVFKRRGKFNSQSQRTSLKQ